MLAIVYLKTLIALQFLRYAAADANVATPDKTIKHQGALEQSSEYIKDVKATEETHATDDVVEKKELAETGEKLEQAAEETKVSQRIIDTISKEQENIKEEIGRKNLDRVKELLAKRKDLLKQIAAIGKTLRVEHDARFPHLVGKPIVIIAKDEDDTKRAANTLAHLEGLNDAMNKIRSPCSSLERIRSAALETTERDKQSRFAVIQKTLDAMSAEERLNYDHKMIEHFEGIIREIENGIAKANEEIAEAWKSYTQ